MLYIDILLCLVTIHDMTFQVIQNLTTLVFEILHPRLFRQSLYQTMPNLTKVSFKSSHAIAILDSSKFSDFMLGLSYLHSVLFLTFPEILTQFSQG